MRRRLILHIGPHKTGSSALQRHLALNRRALAARGVTFPRPVRPVGWLGSVHRDLCEPQTAAELQALVAAYAERIDASGAETAILSAEGLGAAQRDHTAALARLGDAFDVRVITFVRRMDFFLESLYRQLIRNQNSLDRREFRPFANWRLNNGQTDRVALLDRWEMAFGAGSVVAIPYEPAVPGFDVIDRFAAAAGLQAAMQGLPRWHRLPVNSSLSRSQAEFLRRVNNRGRRLSRCQIALLGRFGRDGGAYLGRDSHAAMVAQGEAELEDIRRRHVADGRRVMFPTPPEREPPQTEDWDHRLDPAFERRMRRLLLVPGG